MKFEEEFPSLKNASLYIDSREFKVRYEDGKKERVYREREIQHTCLDKQKVKEALIEFEARSEPNKQYEIFSEEVRLGIFKKRLGLDK